MERSPAPPDAPSPSPPHGAGWTSPVRRAVQRWEANPRLRPLLEQARAKRDVLMVLGMILAIALPALATLATVKVPIEDHHLLNPGSSAEACLQDNQTTVGNPSPWGYTVSLLLFFVPVVVVIVWQALHPKNPAHRRALLAAGAVIASIGVFLDFIFGYSFFCFPNRDATVGLRLPAWSFADMRWVPSYLPIEEFGFYILGSLFVIALYIWANNNWFSKYEISDYQGEAHRHPKLIQLNPWILVLWAVLMVGGVLFKRYGNHPYQEGIPGYFFFIMILGFLPIFVFLRGVGKFVNWRAFTFSYFILLFVSLMWEATLGVPYDWWNYKYDQMLGHHITAWANLPIEAVLLWLAVAWNCVLAYEIFRVYLHMDPEERTVRRALLGGPAPPSTATLNAPPMPDA